MFGHFTTLCMKGLNIIFIILFIEELYKKPFLMENFEQNPQQQSCWSSSSINLDQILTPTPVLSSVNLSGGRLFEIN